MKLVPARWHCARCGHDGRWFKVAEDRAVSEITRRWTAHQQTGCPVRRRTAEDVVEVAA